MSLLAVLLVIFVVLKLCGLIAWAWVWVLAPLWVPLVLSAVTALLGISLIGLGHASSRRRVRR